MLILYIVWQLMGSAQLFKPIWTVSYIAFYLWGRIPGDRPSDNLKYQVIKFISPSVVPVVLICPSYYEGYAHYSTGESYAFDCHGYACDCYYEKTVAMIASALM